MSEKEKVTFDANEHSVENVEIDQRFVLESDLEGYIDEDGVFVVTG